MYRIKDAATGAFLEDIISPIWMRQQELMDYPISCDEYAEADGLYLSDDTTLVGIEGRNMQDYKPTVIVEEVSADPYLFAQLGELKEGLAQVQKYQTEGTVLTSELDEAYREGVNAYAE